jgi:hypothetical protein
VFNNFVVALGTANKSVDFKNVQVKKGFDLLGGKFTVNPRFNIKSTTGDVKLGYEMDKTAFGVTALGDATQLTVSRKIGDNTVVMPSITTDGDFSLSVKQSTDIGAITGTFKANDSINLQLATDTYVANMVAPIEGYRYNGVKLSVKKSLDF